MTTSDPTYYLDLLKRFVRKYRRFYTIKLINVPTLLKRVCEQADRHNSIIIMKYTLKAVVTYLLSPVDIINMVPKPHL